jgi:hypothetical protein
MISCSSVQRALAARIHERLVAGEVGNPKLDHLDIAEGERWRQTIAWWLSACQVAVVLLSQEALDSPWVRYELSVLSGREQLGNVHLVLVYVGMTPDEVHSHPELEPLQLGEIQSYHELVDGKPDDEELDALVATVRKLGELGALDAPPIESLVVEVGTELQPVAKERVASARADLDGPTADPWLLTGDDVRRDFAEAYCATPLDRTYPSLQTLAQDDNLQVKGLNCLIDLNVMTAFDARTVDQLREAGLGGPDRRRSLVTSITRADLADVAAESVRFHTRMYPYRFVVHWPITGASPAEVTEGLASELRDAIAELADDDEEAEDFLDAVAARGHPVFALLAGAAGITAEVLLTLERSFPTVVFVVLSSERRTMLDLADQLGIEGVGAELQGSAWKEHVQYERRLATERSTLRKDLQRLKRALQR